jgi:hypothetical protein
MGKVSQLARSSGGNKSVPFEPHLGSVKHRRNDGSAATSRFCVSP